MAIVFREAQEQIKLTVAAGHPAIFLWVKHLKESMMATVDAELAKTVGILNFKRGLYAQSAELLNQAAGSRRNAKNYHEHSRPRH